MLKDQVLTIDVVGCVGILTTVADGEIVSDVVDTALTDSHQRLTGTGATAVDTASGGSRSVITTVSAARELARLGGAGVVAGLVVCDILDSTDGLAR